MAMDPVNHKALKGKFAQRKDKDINNDGKIDSTDKYLHTRRKAISKNIKNKGETATMNPKLNNKTTSENKIDELNLHFNADDANNHVNAKKMIAHLKKRGIDAEHQGGSGHRARVKVNTTDASHTAYIKNKVKGRYDVKVHEKVEESHIRKSLKSVLETKQAKHGPSDETRDTFEKQLSTRKGEKDFVDAHKTSEVPVDGNVAAKQTADAIANSVKAAPGRTNDQKTGDKNIIPSPTAVLNKIKEAYASMFK